MQLSQDQLSRVVQKLALAVVMQQVDINFLRACLASAGIVVMPEGSENYQSQVDLAKPLLEKISLGSPDDFLLAIEKTFPNR